MILFRWAAGFAAAVVASGVADTLRRRGADPAPGSNPDEPLVLALDVRQLPFCVAAVVATERLSGGSLLASIAAGAAVGALSAFFVDHEPPVDVLANGYDDGWMEHVTF